MTAKDFRVVVGMSRHWKVRLLMKELGPLSFWAYVNLLEFATVSHCDGSFAGLSDEAIGATIEYDDGPLLLATLKKYKLLDGEPGNYSIHDWAEHNPYVAEFANRSETNRQNVKKRWERENAAGNRSGGNGSVSTPDTTGIPIEYESYTSRIPSDTTPIPPVYEVDTPVPVPIPSTTSFVRTRSFKDSPIPQSKKGDLGPPGPDWGDAEGGSFDHPPSASGRSPSQKDSKAKAAEEALLESFSAFWAIYPRKDDKQGALKAWRKLKPDTATAAAIGDRVKILIPSPQWSDKTYIPHGATFLNRRRWEDDLPADVKPPAPLPVQPSSRIDPVEWMRGADAGLPASIRQMKAEAAERQRQLAAQNGSHDAAPESKTNRQTAPLLRETPLGNTNGLPPGGIVH